MAHLFRFETIVMLQDHLINFRDDLAKCQQSVVELTERYQGLTDNFSQGVVDTLTNQTAMCLKKDKYMEKWGEH